MKPTTPNTRLSPSVSGPLSRQVRALRMTVSWSKGHTVKRMQEPVNLRKKRLEMQANGKENQSNMQKI